MSAESKKKRGESGKSNAAHIAFRYGNRPKHYTLSTATYGTKHPRLAGARMLHAMILGSRLPGFNPSHRLVDAADRTIEHLEQRHGDYSHE